MKLGTMLSHIIIFKLLRIVFSSCVTGLKNFKRGLPPSWIDVCILLFKVLVRYKGMKKYLYLQKEKWKYKLVTLKIYQVNLLDAWNISKLIRKKMFNSMFTGILLSSQAFQSI